MSGIDSRSLTQPTARRFSRDCCQIFLSTNRRFNSTPRTKYSLFKFRLSRQYKICGCLLRKWVTGIYSCTILEVSAFGKVALNLQRKPSKLQAYSCIIKTVGNCSSVEIKCTTWEGRSHDFML